MLLNGDNAQGTSVEGEAAFRSLNLDKGALLAVLVHLFRTPGVCGQVLVQQAEPRHLHVLGRQS